MMYRRNAVVYIHGKNGCAAESEHYKPLFPDQDVIGLDYQTFTPWETGKEIHAAIEALTHEYDSIILIANSIGAFFCMHAKLNGFIQKAFFISPIIDVEKLMADMMRQENVDETELAAKGTIPTTSGEELSWEYLRYIRSHPINWDIPTEILYGSGDGMTSPETVRHFAETHHMGLTVMEGGEHWFHTEEQMCFLDNWIVTME